MKIYALPAKPRALLLDIDGTLYTNHEYGTYQIDVLVEELSRTRGEALETTKAAIAGVREAYAAANGGKSTSLGNAMAMLGVDLPTSVAWRARLIDPHKFLSPNPELRSALERWRDRGLTLVAVTNNPRVTGESGLTALGVRDLFKAVVGLDDTMKSKPAPEPYRLAARLADSPCEHCVSVGDRYDVDLAPALELGMGAILVDGVEDVIALDAVLPPKT